MKKKQTGVTRREFLLETALAAGAVALGPGLTWAAQAGAPKIGAQLIGKLEGPVIITDLKQYPEEVL